MKRYEVHRPPVKQWPSLWWRGYKMLVDLTFGKGLREMNSLRKGK